MDDESNEIKTKNLEQINNSKNHKNVRFSSPNIFSQDFLYFKNDIIRELKEIHTKFENQKRLNTTIKDLISSQDIKVVNLNNKLENISNVFNIKKAIAEYDSNKISELLSFKSKIESSLDSFECKMKLNAEEIKKAINRYDRIISDNILLPGIVGSDTKFRDFRDLFYYILTQIKTFNAYKEKNTIDLASYKTKLDSIVNSLNIQISSINTNANAFTTTNINKLEKKCFDEIKTFDDKIMKMRVDIVEMIQNFQKDKKQILDEWDNLKNMKQDLIELIESSINKEKNSNNQIRGTLDNFEMQINELKNTINDLHKLKKENNKYFNYNNNNNNNYNHKIKQEKQDLKINNNDKIDIFNLPSSNNEKNEKSDNNNTNEKGEKKIKNNTAKRIQSSKTYLQKYIEGNSLYHELIRQNSLRCEKHKNDTSEQSMHLIMRKYYDEGLLYAIKNKNTNRTIENNVPKNNNSPKNDKSKLNNNTFNTTPKSNFNINKKSLNLHNPEKSTQVRSLSPRDTKGSKYHELFNMNDIDNKNTIQYINKNRKPSSKKRIVLMKEENNENDIYNNYNKKSNNINKIKLKDVEKKLIERNKFKHLYIDKNKLFNIRQLSSISFLYDDMKSNKCPKLDKYENIKEYETFSKSIKGNKKIKHKMNNTFLKEYNALSSFKFKNNNLNNNNNNKIRQRKNSSEFFKLNNCNENDKDNSTSFINNIYNEYFSEKNKNNKINQEISIKNSIYKLSNEKHK